MPPGNGTKDAQDALMELLAPDGYYSYLGIPKPDAVSTVAGKGSTGIDEDAVKKNYRKLSLRLHPDKPGGDAETFQLLHRAQKVLLTPRLRQQYDVLGIDLDDDDVHNPDHSASSGSGNNNAHVEEPDVSKEQGLIQEIAGNVLTVIIQFGVRTRKCPHLVALLLLLLHCDVSSSSDFVLFYFRSLKTP
jgi:DnaJ domain